MSVEQFKGGQSNPTYKLVMPGKSYVLRRKPPGQLLKGAHAVERRAKVLTGFNDSAAKWRWLEKRCCLDFGVRGDTASPRNTIIA